MLDDGGEVDLDLGNYERFLDVTLTRDNNLTTGKVYNKVITAEVRFLFFPHDRPRPTHEQLTRPNVACANRGDVLQRRGDYLGKTVQGTGSKHARTRVRLGSRTRL